MEDIGVSEELESQEDENGGMGEDDDADLCYDKHTGKYWDLSTCNDMWCTSLLYWSNKNI